MKHQNFLNLLNSALYIKEYLMIADTKFGLINPIETKNKKDKKMFSKYDSEKITYKKTMKWLNSHKNINLFSEWVLSCFKIF